MQRKALPTDAEFARLDVFERLLFVHELTAEELKAGVPRVVHTLLPEDLAALHDADFDHPETMTHDQAALFQVLLVRTASMLSAERARQEREQGTPHN